MMSACGPEPLPTPRGELRLDYGEKSYKPVNTGCPYTFELADNTVMTDAQAQKGRCWKDIHFPKLNATVHLTYLPVQENLERLLKDTRDMTYEHHIKASNIESELIVESDRNVYGLMYNVSGDVASTNQFYLTDSTNHFIRGALYFNCKPNWDSLVPAVKYIEADIKHLVETFKWQGQTDP